jgi:hypothetical protein
MGGITMQIVEVRLSVFLDRSKIRYGLAWYASFWSLFDFKLAIVIMGALISTPILCRAQSSGSTLQQMVVTGQFRRVAIAPMARRKDFRAAL